MAEVAKFSIRIDQAGLFLAGATVTHEFHGHFLKGGFVPPKRGFLYHAPGT